MSSCKSSSFVRSVKRERRNLSVERTKTSADIPNDLWCTIGSKLNSARDRVRFRAVCKSWSSLLPPIPHPPCLMRVELLSRTKTQPSIRLFMSLGRKTPYTVDIPEIRRMRCIGSSGNWLLTLDNDEFIYLTNLFTRLQKRLPRRGLIVSKDGLRKIVSTSWEEPDFIAMAIHKDQEKLAVLRQGDTSWIDVQLPEEYRVIEDIIFCRQKFYAVTPSGKLMVCDVGGGGYPPRFLRLNNDSDDDDDDDDYEHRCSLDNKCECKYYYLVELLGELLVVIKYLNFDYEVIEDDYRRIDTTLGFRVYKFDFSNMVFVEVKCLREHSLLAGRKHTCVSVLASDYFGLVRKNCIYTVDDSKNSQSIANAHVVRVFSMSSDLEDDDGTDSDFEDTISFMDTSDNNNFISWLIPRSSITAPVWIVPTQAKM